MSADVTAPEMQGAESLAVRPGTCDACGRENVETRPARWPGRGVNRVCVEEHACAEAWAAAKGAGRG